MHFSGTISFPYDALLKRCAEFFPEASLEQTVDGINTFHTRLTILMHIRGTFEMEYPIKFRVNAYGNRAKLDFDVDMAKVYGACLLMATFLSFLFYLVNPHWLAVIFGVLGGAILFSVFVRGIGKGLWRFEKELRTRISSEIS